MKTYKMDVRFRLQGAEIKYKDGETELYRYNAGEDPGVSVHAPGGASNPSVS